MKYVSTTLEALQEEHQNALNDAQSEMMAVLGEAQNSGDFSKMQEISESFQKTSMLLMEAFEDRIKELTAIPEELPMEKYYGDNRTDIDLDALVYNGDRDYVLGVSKG